MISEDKLIKLCGHCFNETVHEMINESNGKKLYEQIDSFKYYEPFKFILLKCTTCDCISVYGDFVFSGDKNISHLKLLYPLFGELGEAIPLKICEIYKEIRPFREKAPNAFANQIRIALELICKDKQAKGNNLFNKLNDLSERGIFPGQIMSDMAHIIRYIGNIGSHASEIELDIWDVQLLDDIFRMIIDYTYMAPDKLNNLKRRMEFSKNKK